VLYLAGKNPRTGGKVTKKKGLSRGKNFWRHGRYVHLRKKAGQASVTLTMMYLKVEGGVERDPPSMWTMEHEAKKRPFSRARKKRGHVKGDRSRGNRRAKSLTGENDVRLVGG